MPDIIIRQPDDTEFAEVKEYVQEFWLDNSNMSKEQFLILLYKGRFAVFGRIKEHAGCSELCTLGVVNEFRGKHLGEALVKALVKKAKSHVYLVTVIPDFFSLLGFAFTEKYPASMKRKVEVCTKEYHVGETYKVMKWTSQ